MIHHPTTLERKRFAELAGAAMGNTCESNELADAVMRQPAMPGLAGA